MEEEFRKEFTKKHQEFWAKMDTPQFWEKIKLPSYIRTPCTSISYCNKICQVFIKDSIVEVLWDYVKKCILIQDGTNWYHMQHNFIPNLTIRQVVIGLGYNYMETEWSDNGEDVLDIIAHKAPLSTIRTLTLDDVDMCEKL